MKRSKQRKALEALPRNLPPAILEKALKNVTNDKVRQQLRAQYQRREAAPR